MTPQTVRGKKETYFKLKCGFIDIKGGIPNMVVKRLYQAIAELLQAFHMEKKFVCNGTQHYMVSLLKKLTHSLTAQQWSTHGIYLEQRFIDRISALHVLNAI